MALDHLLAALEREAQATATRLRAEARTEAERLTVTSSRAVEQRRDAEVEIVVRERRHAMERELAAERRRVRGEVLVARERLLARIAGAVRARLRESLGRSEYLVTLGERLAAGVACLGGESEVTVRCPGELVGPIRSSWPATPAADVRQDETLGGGFRLTTADGAIEVEDTLEARFESLRDLLMREALAQIGKAG